MTSRGSGIVEAGRRTMIAALGAGALGFALFGPRGVRERTDGRIVLDYWEKWTRHEGDAMQRVVDAFNASQDRIFVRYLVTAGIHQKALVAIAGGSPPDVIGLYAYNVPPYAEAGAILPLDDAAARAGLSMDMYAPGVRQVMRHSGRWWAVVNTAGSVALYYNRALFNAAGLDPDRPPRTIAQFDEAYRRLTETGPGGELRRVGFLHSEPGWWTWLWPYQFGGSIYDPGTNRALLASPPVLESYRWLQSYPRTLGVANVIKFQEGFGNYFTPENPFLTGKVAMIVQGPWIANLINAFKPDLDYASAPFPTRDEPTAGAGPVGLIDTDVLVIPRGARHPEASMEFIAFTQRQDMIELLATAHCKPSPLARSSAEFLASHPNRGLAVHNEILASDRAFIPPPTRVWQQFKDELDSAVQRMWRLEAEADEILPVLQARVQGIIDLAAEQQRRRHGEHAA